MIQSMVFGIVGGLGLFLFGMGLMSDGLKKVAGQKLKGILESMTKRAVVAFLVGAGITALVQSSSATTVMVVGFVNAGLLTLKQAICVVIGTNVGTTMTAWLVSMSGIGKFSVGDYAPLMIAAGFLMQTLSKTRRMKSMGQVLLGFGILFMGIDLMKGAFGGLKENPARIEKIFATLANHPGLAILAGAVVTMLLQSSSAAIAIVQAMAMGMGAKLGDWQQAVNFVIPFVVGSNIGTTITAQLAALQANLNAKRTAWAHTTFNILGSIIAYPLIHFGLFAVIVRFVAPWEASSENIVYDIALAHTIFNVVNSGLFLPFAGMIERIVIRLLPERPSDAAVRPVVLEQHLLDTPVLALNQAELEMIRMAKASRRAVERTVEGIIEKDTKKLASVREIEDFVDSFQLEITTYLSTLSRKQLSDEVSIELPVLLHAVNDLERISDLAVNIVEIAERKIEHKQSFSESALAEAERLRDEVETMFNKIITAFESNDLDAARAALECEEKLNDMQMEFRRSHVGRMTEGKCTAEAGLIFIDLVDNVEKIGDHLTNIAQAIIGGMHWEGVKPNGSSKS